VSVEAGLGHARFIQQVVQGGDLSRPGTCGGAGKDKPVCCPRQADEERGGRLVNVALVGPPLVFVEPEEENCVVFESLTAGGWS
jgi:hypothetical protein